MSKLKTSSKDLLKSILEPHANLALDLLKMVQSLNTNDSSHRFQIASVIIFLAGIDKTLSLAFELLYLAGMVDWNWMVPNKKQKPAAGFIECQRGLAAKIAKLNELGVDLTSIKGINELRNEYVHSTCLYVGYSICIDEFDSKFRLVPSGPVLTSMLPPLIAFTQNEIEFYTYQFVELIGSFIDKTDWREIWYLISQKANGLPHNPDPEYSQFLDEPEIELEVLDALNIRYVGDGVKLLCGQSDP